MRLCIIAFCALISFCTSAHSDKKIALIIGNSDYKHLAPLPNAVNDATAIAKALGEIGFEVHRETNVGYDGIRQAVLNFGRISSSADVALVYYAGHGVGSGENYLIPVDAELKYSRDLPIEGISQRILEDAVKDAKNLKLVILDACRNDLSTRMVGLAPSRDISRGFKSTDPESGILVAYSAKHGTLALDGPPGGNSPFATAFMRHLPTPGLEIAMLFRRIGDDVKHATKGQEPYTYGSLPARDLFLVPPQDTKDTASVADCNRLAASPRDPNSGFKGIETKFIDAKAALLACSTALKHAPSLRVKYQLARAYLAAEKYNEAKTLYEELISSNYAMAFYDLAVMYDEGLSLSIDGERAVNLYRKAADLGIIQSYAQLGALYFYGTKVPKSIQIALENYSLGAAKGEPYAIYSMAWMHANGFNGQPSVEEVASLFEKAASKGNGLAANELGRMYCCGVYGAKADIDKAKKFFQMGIDIGNPHSMYNMAALILNRDSKDSSKAKQAAMLVVDSMSYGCDCAIKENAWRTLNPSIRLELQNFLKAEGIYRDKVDGAARESFRFAIETLYRRKNPAIQ